MDIRIAVLLAKFRVTVPGMTFVLESVRGRGPKRKKAVRPDLVWVPSGDSWPGVVWTGQQEEFVRELAAGTLVGDRAGLFINVAAIAHDLEEQTSDTGA